MEDTSELKHKTLLSAGLEQDEQGPGRWAGELSIPSSWMEGGIRMYDKTSRARPSAR